MENTAEEMMTRDYNTIVVGGCGGAFEKFILLYLAEPLAGTTAQVSERRGESGYPVCPRSPGLNIEHRQLAIEP